MEEGKEKFLSRWSRLKRAVAGDAPAAVPAPLAPGAAVPAELPALDALEFSSDFTGFLRPDVEESMKRAAMKKLFHSGQFNTMDGLDVYIDDYNTFEPIPEAMLRRMQQARGLLFADEEELPPQALDRMAPEAETEAVPAEPQSVKDPATG
jgi:hypothetical protein